MVGDVIEILYWIGKGDCVVFNMLLLFVYMCICEIVD